MAASVTASFTPAFAGFESRVRESFARQGAMALVGAQLGDVRPGYCAISLLPRPEVSQQHGYVHAGILATLVDTAGGYAGYTLFPEDSSVLTVEFKLNLLAPVSQGVCVAVAEIIALGKRSGVARIDISNDGRAVCAAQGTVTVVHPTTGST